VKRSLLLVLLLSPAVGVAQLPQAPVTGDSTVSVISVRKAIDTGHPDQALAEIESLRKSGSHIAGLDRLMGTALYAKGDLRAADGAFASALEQDPKDVEAAQMRGLTLFRLGRPADAIPLLERSSSGTIAQVDPNYILGLCYMDTRRYDDARHAFAAQFGVPQDSATAYLVAARMLLRRQYVPVSQQFARKALEIDPALPLAHELLGEIALADGHTDEAITELEKERLRNPVAGSVYNRLGDAYLREGKLDDAERVLEQDVLLEPNATGPYILLGKVKLKKGDGVGAVTFLEHARVMDPGNYMTHNLLGQAYRAIGRSEDATRELDVGQRLQAASEPKLENSH
jgi:tetratricopeptide (TPR) repeat protein